MYGQNVMGRDCVGRDATDSTPVDALRKTMAENERVEQVHAHENRILSRRCGASSRK